MSVNFGEEHFGSAGLGDPRRTRRLVSVANQIHRHPGGTLPEKFQSPKDYKAMDRLMNRPEVTHASVLRPHLQRTLTQMQATPGVVLVLHDTTELDYSGLKSIADLGALGNGHGRGLLCHNSLAYDPDSQQVLGLANQILHRRRHVGKKEGAKAKRERKDRESRLWTQAVAAIPVVPGRLCVHVADRGADTFEFLAQQVAADRHFVVRSSANRCIRLGHQENGASAKLHEHLRSLPLQGRREIEVAAKPGQRKRKATLAVAHAVVQLWPPHVKRGDYENKPLPVWGVRVYEIEPPKGIEPLEWFLITNVPVLGEDDAWLRALWYGIRWVIEEFHKGMKTGCAIEELQFTTADALEPMIALLSVAAIGLLNLREASRRPDAKEKPATIVLDERYVKMLSAWRYKKVRHLTIHEAFLAIARLGGHMNRKSDHRPGWLVLWRGWMALEQMLSGADALQSCG
jgi:hypothetical protein